MSWQSSKSAVTYLVIHIQLLLQVGFLTSASAASNANDQTASQWSQVTEILSRIRAPIFPANEFIITEFGAVGDGNSDCTAAIGDAIEACHKARGRVVVPEGEFLTGPIHLQSNVELHLARGATLKFTTDPKSYLPVVFTRFEGMECYNYSPLIYALGQENIAVTGDSAPGTDSGVQFSTFEASTSNNARQVLFRATLAGPHAFF